VPVPVGGYQALNTSSGKTAPGCKKAAPDHHGAQPLGTTAAIELKSMAGRV